MSTIKPLEGRELKFVGFENLAEVMDVLTGMQDPSFNYPDAMGKTHQTGVILNDEWLAEVYEMVHKVIVIEKSKTLP